MLPSLGTWGVKLSESLLGMERSLRRRCLSTPGWPIKVILFPGFEQVELTAKSVCTKSAAGLCSQAISPASAR